MSKSPYEPRAFWKESEKKYKQITEADVRRIVGEELKKIEDIRQKDK